MKITNLYRYTIDEMKQIIAEWEEMGQIINDYKASERIEDLTEEEFICLFGESTLYPNIYFADPGEGYDYACVSDYDWHLLENGINPFTGDIFNQAEWPACHIIVGVDTIDPADVAQDLCWAKANLTFEEALEQASNLDRFYLIIDEKDNIIGSGLFDAGDNIEEYFRINYIDNYEYMKVDEPDSLSQGELECSLADDQDYYLSLRTKNVELYVADMTALGQLLNEPIHETISHLIIHMDASGKKFLIVVTADGQLIYYKVITQIDPNSPDNLKTLGWDIFPESVLEMIDYFIETGLTLRRYQ